MVNRWDCVSGTMVPDDSGPYVPYHDYLSTACDRDEQLHAYLTWREEAERLKAELAAERAIVDWIAEHSDLDHPCRPGAIALRWYDSEGDERFTCMPAVGIPGENRFDPRAGLRAAVGKAREEETGP